MVEEKLKEFQEKLAPCIEKGDLDVCVDQAFKLAQEMEIAAIELKGLSVRARKNGLYVLAYVLALAAAEGLEGAEKSKAYNNAGTAARHIGDLKNSEIYHKQAIELDPKSGISHNNYANLLKDLGRKDEAEYQYKQAIELDPKSGISRNNYGNLLTDFGLYESAEYQYKKAIELDPEYATAHNNYANLLTDLGRYVEAEYQYKQAMELDPKYVNARNNYAILLKDIGRYDEAKDQYKKVIELDKKSAAAHYNYAYFLMETSRLNEAIAEMKLVLQIEPENPYAFGTLADILADKDYLEAAEESYLISLKHSDSMKPLSVAEIHNNLGRVYAKLKQYNKAEEQFRTAFRLDPMNENVIHNLRIIRSTDITKSPNQNLVAYIILPLFFIGFFYLFHIQMISDICFITIFIFLSALFIFTLTYHTLTKAKIGPSGLEFEMGTSRKSIEAEIRPIEFKKYTRISTSTDAAEQTQSDSRSSSNSYQRLVR